MDIFAGWLHQNNETYLGSPLEIVPDVAYPCLVILFVGAIFGSCGNAMVIGSIFLIKSLQHIGNAFIINLAMADLVVTLFVDPFGIVGILIGETYFIERPLLCELVASFCLTACYCSLLSIGAISLNRYVCICHHTIYSRIYTRRNTIIMCVGIWIVSFSLEFPNFVGWGDHKYDRKNLACVWDRTANLSYTIFFVVCGVVIPTIMISLCYLKLYLYVRNANKKIHAHGMTNESRMESDHIRKSIKLAKTLFIIFMVFAICWTPYAIMVVADVNDEFPVHLHAYSVVVAHFNSSFNSLIYGLSNKEFQRGYKAVIRCLLNALCCSKIKARRIIASPTSMASRALTNNNSNITQTEI